MSYSSSEKDLEEAMNDWMRKIELQINGVEDKIYSKKEIEKRIKNVEDQVSQAKTVASSSEKLANRLVDDVMAGQEEIQA